MNNYLNKNMIFKALSVTASVSVIFSGCVTNISQNVNSAVHLSSNIEETANSPTPDLDTLTSNIESPIDNPDIITYCAKEKSSENQIYFNYPQFSETKDNYEEINPLIVDFVKSNIQSYIRGEFNGNIKDSPEDWKWDNGEYSLWGMNVDYKITRNDSEYLSVTFDGLLNYRSAAHPIHYFNSLVIDVQNCKVAALSDICKVDMNFLNLIRNKYKEQIRPGLAEKLGISVDDIPKDIGNELPNYDDSSLLDVLCNRNSDSKSAFSYFLTDTGLGISVPLIYALGDHFEVMIKYDELN